MAGSGDFNNDQKADILWRDTSGDVGVWFMNGAAIQQSAVLGKVSTNWIIAGADVSGDIFWRNTATGEVGMWVMNGTQIAQTADFGIVPLLGRSPVSATSTATVRPTSYGETPAAMSDCG